MNTRKPPESISVSAKPLANCLGFNHILHFASRVVLEKCPDQNLRKLDKLLTCVAAPVCSKLPLGAFHCVSSDPPGSCRTTWLSVTFVLNLPVNCREAVAPKFCRSWFAAAAVLKVSGSNCMFVQSVPSYSLCKVYALIQSQHDLGSFMT